MFRKKWILSQDEKSRLCELLKRKTTWPKERDSGWEIINEGIYLGINDLSWNNNLTIEIPPMPDYMNLSDK